MNSAITPASFGAGTEALRTLSPAYKRIYQACIPCRRRKVRCDLGPVDEPHEPPCVRCRRESKDCFFSATRRKRKASGQVIDEEAALEDDYAIRNRRRRNSHLARSSSGDGVLPHPIGSVPLARALYDSSRSRGYHGDLGSSGSQHDVPEQGSQCISSIGQEEDEEVSNETAAALFHSPIHNPRDALHLLLEASGRSEVLDRDFTNNEEDVQHFNSIRANYEPKGEPSVNNLEGGRSQRGTNTRTIDPALSEQSRKANTLSDPYLLDALRAWYHLRFVRAGWFTAQEAMSYVDYFFNNLAPLSPVALPNFRLTQTHPYMLQEEPVLSVTILTIAARYKRLPGPGGQSRSFVIHERLSAYLQTMLTRAFWAQEQYGGGFCGAGRRSTFSGGTKGVGLRSIGTIESILLICDWHPRSMHFNPGDDDGQLLLPLKEDIYTRYTPDIVGGDGKLNRKESLCTTWDEPALRSDQMSWSLLGMAYTLALELGIFGTFDASSSFDNRIALSSVTSLENRGRTQRIKRLLYIYITQVSGRLGLPSMLPEHHQGAQTSIEDYGVILPASEAVEDIIQEAWVKAASIVRTGNAMVFPTKDTARHLIQSGEYFRVLDEHLLPLLESWRKAFRDLKIPQYPRIMLSIEYEYIRIYFNSLAVQAVLNRWTNANSAAQKTRNSLAKDDHSRSSLMGFYKRNEYYIREVVDGSRNLLRHIVVGLLPNDHLKHATVRTYNRILSGATFLLKTLALGGKESEVNISLRLLDDTAKALRTSVVDDVHLCLRIADLLEGLTTTIRHRFVRITVSATRKSNIAGLRLSNESSERLRPFYSSDIDGDDNPHAYIARNTLLADNQPPEQSPPTNLNTSTPLKYNDMNNDPMDGSYNAPADTFTFPGTEDWLTLDFNPLLDAADNAGMNEWFANFGPDIHNNLDGLGRFMDGFGDEGFGDGGGGFG